MLRKLLAKKSLTILGLNSGTSADGLDLAVIRFRMIDGRPRIGFVVGRAVAYPSRVKRELEGMLGDRKTGIEEAARFDIAYGRYLGKSAVRFIAEKGLNVDLIASHGQTIGHFPEKKKVLGNSTGATFQAGDGNAIACETGIPVVSDFRRADVASRGEGAPLTPFVNHLLFGDGKRSRIVVNIGGIANFSYHPAGGLAAEVRGGDCGPGNVLSDMANQLLFHKPYDKDGRIADRGEVIDEIIERIDEANRQRGVSAGREQFGWPLFAGLVYAARRHRAQNQDIVASITAATAWLIARSLEPFLADRRLEAIYLTGGGRRNRFLVKRLAEAMKPHRVLLIEDMGYDGDLLEAASFAALGGCFIHGLPSTLPQVTGAVRSAISGKLSLPPGGSRSIKRVDR